MKKKTKVLATSVATIATCASLAVGGTFALFTSESKVNIAVTSGTVKMVATVDGLTHYTNGEAQTENWVNGGKASFTSNTVTLERITPGDKAEFTIKLENESNVNVQYRTLVDVVSDNGLVSGLTIKVNDDAFTGFAYQDWQLLEPKTAESDKAEVETVTISVELPKEKGNEYQTKETKLSFTVEAVQSNAEHTDTINGLTYGMKTDAVSYMADSDTTAKAEPEVYYINNETDLKIFGANVNSGVEQYTGKTVVLTEDIDLKNKFLMPIGYTSTNDFEGNFVGGDHTISNFYQYNGEAGGLFGYVDFKNESKTEDGKRVEQSIDSVNVENVTINANRRAGGIVGYIYGDVTDCSANNVNITLTPNYANGAWDNGDKAGGLIGWAGGTSNVNGNAVTGVEIAAYRDFGGVIGYFADSNPSAQLKNNSVTGATLQVVETDVDYGEKGTGIGAIYGDVGVSKDGTCKVQIEGNRASKIDLPGDEVVTTDQTEMKDALKAGEVVSLAGDVVSDAINGGYSKAGAVVNGGTLDGNGYTLTAEGANGTWDCVLYTTGGMIKNITIGGGFRGIFTAGCKSDIVIDNVIIDDVCYTISADEANLYELCVTNSTLNGWTSYTQGYKAVSFTDCNFGAGTGGYKYAYCRPYSATTFTNCVFEAGYEFDARQTTCTFDNCYVGETLITAENVVELLGADAANVAFVCKTANDVAATLASGKEVVLTEDVDLNGATVTSNGDIKIVGNGETKVSNATFQVADDKTATFEGVVFDGTTSVYATGDNQVELKGCTFEIAPNKLVNNSRAAAIIGNHQYSEIDLTVEDCVFNYQNAGADTYNAAIFMWSSVKNCVIRNNEFNGYGFVAVKLMNVAEGATIEIEGNTFNMSAVGSANYWYNCAVQIVPQHDRTFSVSVKNNTFNGGYQTGADLVNEYGFSEDNNDSIVVEVAGMNYGFGLSKLTFTQEGNTVNGDAATEANFAIKRATAIS